MRFFGRSCRVTAYRQGTGFIGANPDFFERLDNGIEITGLRIQAEITKTIGSSPNRCDLTITNLSDTDRAELLVGTTTIVLDAGYDGVLQQLFVGHLKNIPAVARDHASRETKLQLLDGGRAYRSARINRSYKTGTPLRTIIKDAASALGWTLPRAFEASPELDQRIASGLALEGSAADELTRLLAPYGYGWSSQNGKLQILRDDQTSNDDAWLIDDDGRGLVGEPTWDPPPKGKPPKLSFRCLLFPELAPGGKVQLDVPAVRGLHRIFQAKHTIDTRGQDWYTDVEARRL